MAIAKTISGRFKQLRRMVKNQYLSDVVIFNQTIRDVGHNYKEKSIWTNFNKYVSKSDYDKSDKRNLIRFAVGCAQR